MGFCGFNGGLWVFWAFMGLYSCVRLFKASQGLLFSEARKPYAEAAGHRAGAGARGCGLPHPPVSQKSPARDKPSFGCVVQTRQFLFGFSLRCVGFSRSSVLETKK